MATVAYPGTPGTVIYGGLPTPSGGTALTTITLANTSATEQSAGFVSPMFGLPLKQGDVPAGQYPQFTLTDDTPVPATIHSVTSWPDGSMKWCGVFLRVPSTVAGSGSLAITVKNGGSAPGSSARAVSDLTAANLSVELTGVTNLTGTWTASLNDAITNGTVVVIGDGPAGMLVRILGDFKQGGSPHGQLACWHYALIAQNASGGLLGIRYLGRVAQPWADVSTPTPTRRVVNALLKAGTSTLRSLVGSRWVNPADTGLGEELSADIEFPHYSSFFTAASDGRWDFVQGGGSAAADCTVRVVHDKAYVMKSQLLPPYALTLNPNSGASVNYNPNCIGAMQARYMGTTGPRAEIGVVPQWAVRHLLTQAAVDERAVRVTGLASGGWRTCIRKQSTKQVIPCVDPSPSYAGLGTIQKTWRYRVGSGVSGVVAPTDETSIWNGETGSDHRGACTYYPYIITGEPQYLDLTIDHAAGILLSTITGGRTMRTEAPITASTLRVGGDYGERDVTIGSTTYKGGSLLFMGELQRVYAWATRDIAEAAAIYPDVCPSGTEVKKYFSDVTDSTFTAALAFLAARPTDWQNSGLWGFNGDAGAGQSPWNAGYLSHSVCHQASILASTKAATFRGYLSKFWSNTDGAMDVAAVGAYNALIYDENTTQIESFSKILFELANCTLTFSTSTSRATISGSNGSWTPTNGDRFAFFTYMDPDKPFTEAVDGKTFYAVNCSGNTFQLSATPGGSPITVTNNAVVTKCYAAIANFSPNFSFQGTGTTTDAYIVDNLGVVNHHLACGDTGLTAAQSAMQAKVTAMGTSFVNDPADAFATSFPS